MWFTCLFFIIWAWWEGELLLPVEPLPAELMEHMLLFLEPSEEGEEGGVWKTTAPPPVFTSVKT